MIVVGGLLLAALTTFYLSEQRAFRQQQIEIQTSQSLRVALEQIVRDLRVAGRNPTGAADIGLTHAAANEVRFTLDADAVSGTPPVLTNRNEHKGFRLNGTAIQTYLADNALSPWQDLADHFDPALTQIFRYYDGNNAELTSLPVVDLGAIRRIDVVLTVTNTVPGGGTITRTEAASVRLRNVP